jgi:amidase
VQTMPEELTEKSATELLGLIRAREVSPVEIAEAHLRRIEQINPSLNAIVTIANDVIDQARAAEQAMMNRSSVGLLHGLPITIKDTIDVAGLRTTAGSRVRAGHLSETDAPTVARLKAAGAIILGKTNVPEMAIPYDCDNPVFGSTNNPYDLDRTSGGSSGGEAAAISACLSPAGIGSDLSGSIRVPAHFCGIAGLKPTAGRVPMDGHTPAATGVVSLGACIGPMARRVEDLALLIEVLADPTQFETIEDERRLADASQLRTTRFALYLDNDVAPVPSEIASAVNAAARALTDGGLEMVDVNPPALSAAAELWIDLFARAANNEIVPLYHGREDEAGPAVARILTNFTERPAEFEDRIEAAEQLSNAVLKRERLREELLAWMKTTPLILAPVGATAAFEHGATRVDVEGESISVFRAFGYSRAINVLGLPAVSVPAGRTTMGLPIGVQIIGRPFAEKLVLAAASIIEGALGGWQAPRLNSPSL